MNGVTLGVLAAGILAISWSAVFVRLCEAPAMVIASYRLGLSALMLVTWHLVAEPKSRHRYSTENMGWLVLSGLCLAFHFLAWIEAVQRAPVAVAVTLSSTHPIMVGLFSRLFLKESFGAWKVLGALLAVLGTAGMAWETKAQYHQGMAGYLCALGAAFFFSVYMMLGRKLRAGMELMKYILPTYGSAALWLLVATGINGLPLTGYTPKTYLMFALLAFIPTIIGHSSLNWALGHLSATLVAVSVLGEPIGASLLAWAFLGEKVGLWRVLFGGLVLAGIYTAAKAEAWERRKFPSRPGHKEGLENSLEQAQH